MWRTGRTRESEVGLRGEKGGKDRGGQVGKNGRVRFAHQRETKGDIKKEEKRG